MRRAGGLFVRARGPEVTKRTRATDFVSKMAANLALGLTLLPLVSAFTVTPQLSSPHAVAAVHRTSTLAMDAEVDPLHEHDEKIEKALKAMVGFSNSYIKNTKTKYCQDPSIPAVVIKGLAEHKVSLGAPLCPCRHYEDKEAEAKDGYWNCPCVPMRERHECHCMLFLTDDNEFAGDNTHLTVEETKEATDGMSIL